MSPCSAKIASASRRKASQPSRSPARPKPATAARNSPGLLAEDLQAPDVDLLQLVELGRDALEVEHDVVGVLGDRGRLEHDRLARSASARALARIRSAPSPTCSRRLPQGRSSSASDSASKRSSSSSIVSTPARRARRSGRGRPRASSPIDRSLDGRRPAALEEAAARALRPADDLVGLLVGEPDAEDRLERLERRLAALVGRRRGSCRRRCGPAARPAARRRSARRASRRAASWSSISGCDRCRSAARASSRGSRSRAGRGAGSRARRRSRPRCPASAVSARSAPW